MKKHLPHQPETEEQKAIKEGYVTRFDFTEDGLRCSSAPHQSYSIGRFSLERPRPCLLSRTTVYRLTAPDRSLGYALLDWTIWENDE